jgi:spore coat protein H
MRYGLLLGGWLLCGWILAQVRHPAQTPLYNPNHVSRIDIAIDADSLAALLHPDNRFSYHEYPATAIISGFNFVDTIYQVGFRLRGNTSRNAQKKSYKVAFNTFQSAQRYRNVKSLNLNGEHNDPSLIRARICWELGARGGLPVSRSQHTQLYINGVYHGVYLNLEHINDDWLQLRYGHQHGNLFKCIYPANLGFISGNPEAYKLVRSDGRRVYDLVTNENKDDYSKLAKFIAILNQSTNAELACALDTIFDIAGYMKTLAFEVVTGHWDNYAFNQNNYYLYDNPATGKLEYIPYDMDNTLGVDWMGIDWATRHVNQWINQQQHLPLAQRLLAIPAFHEIYRFHILAFSDLATSATFQNFIDQIHQQIAPFAATDTFRTLDYGFTISDFQQSLSRTTPLLHVSKGILPFFQQRVSANGQQILPFNMAPVITETRTTFSGPAQWHIATKVLDEHQPTVVLEYQINQGGLLSTTLRDDGNHLDGYPGDGVYGGFVNNLLPGDVIAYQIVATDPAGRQRINPCSPKEFRISAPGPLVINELMATNSQTIADQTGRFEDWIELFNASSDSIWLGDYYLTDNYDQPELCRCPEIALPPGGFQLIWASGVPTRGPNHCAFKLSASGEFLGLFHSQKGFVDSLVFPDQSTDISYGRSVDAALSWTYFNRPTPNQSNGTLKTSIIADAFPVEVYPTPYFSTFKVHNPARMGAHGELYDMQGRLLLEFELPGGQIIEIKDSSPSGLKLLRIKQNNSQKIYKLTKVSNR